MLKALIEQDVRDMLYDNAAKNNQAVAIVCRPCLEPLKSLMQASTLAPAERGTLKAIVV